MTRRFVVVGHKAASAPGFSHKDLAGTGGRIDLLARCMPAAFLVSHGMRQDVELYTVHLGPPTPPKVVRMRSAKLRHLNPDERTTALLLEKALAAPTTGPVWATATPGIDVAILRIDELLDGLAAAPLVVLDEAGDDVEDETLPPDATFVLGDHLGLTDDELATLAARGARRVSLGPVSLQADQCIVVLHNALDRRAGHHAAG